MASCRTDSFRNGSAGSRRSWQRATALSSILREMFKNSRLEGWPRGWKSPPVLHRPRSTRVADLDAASRAAVLPHGRAHGPLVAVNLPTYQFTHLPISLGSLHRQQIDL